LLFLSFRWLASPAANDATAVASAGEIQVAKVKGREL
jgi:hypothetical protein